MKQPAAGAPISDRAVLLRAAADGELTPAQKHALEEHLREHPDDRSVIEFERRLRGAIASGAGAVSSPVLRARIAGLAGSSGEEAIAHSRDAFRLASGWRGPMRWAALAAVLVLVSGAGLFYVRSMQSRLLPTGGAPITETHRLSLISFLTETHRACEMHTDMAMRSFKFAELEMAPSAFAAILGKSLNVESLTQTGLQFVGGGPCSVPGGGRSVHMVFETNEPNVGGRTPMVAIYVQADTGELRIAEQTTYRLTPLPLASDEGSVPDIFVWKRDGLVYFVASASQPAMRTVLAAFGAGEPSGSI